MRMRGRFVAKTAAVACVGALGMLSEGWGVSAPIHRPASLLLATAAEFLARLFGMPTYLDGATVYGLGYAVRVVPQCNGLTMIATLLTAVALLRMSRRRRLLWAVVVLLAVWCLNLLRVVTVLLIGTRSATAAELTHEFVFPVAWVGLFGWLWFLWLELELSEGSSETVGR